MQPLITPDNILCMLRHLRSGFRFEPDPPCCSSRSLPLLLIQIKARLCALKDWTLFRLSLRYLPKYVVQGIFGIQGFLDWWLRWMIEEALCFLPLACFSYPHISYLSAALIAANLKIVNFNS